MKLVWVIDHTDIKKINDFKERHINNLFVRNRIDKNINGNHREISKSIFFKAMVSCLLTTQQRSGPNSAVSKFINSNPFPLDYSICVKFNCEEYIARTLSSYKGIRRTNKIPIEISTNLQNLEKGTWDDIFDIVEKLSSNDSPEVERESAKFISNQFKGFGPKQSRNLLQSLGLTKYEIPLDSRVTKWLNEFGFPINLSSTALSDHSYYDFIMDGFQELCLACNVKPCVMDALIFSSFNDEWPEGALVW